MVKNILIGLLLLTGTAFGALSESDKSFYTERNLLLNGGMESNTAQYTVSGGSLASVSAAANIAVGTRSISWDASATGQFLTSAAVAIPNGLFTTNGQLTCRFKTTATDYTLQAYDGTNILATTTIPSGTTFQKVSLNFPFPSSGNIQFRVASASDAAIVYVDDCYQGSATNLSQINNITNWEAFTPTGSWTTNTTYTGYSRRVGGSKEYDVLVSLAGAPNAVTLTINLPSSDVIDTTKFNSTAGGAGTTIGQYIARDAGTNTYHGVISYSGANTNSQPIGFNVSGANVLSASINATAPFTFGSGDAVYARFTVPIVGLTAQTVYGPDNVAWYVDANISGANPSLGTASVASYTELTNSALTLTQNTGSIATQIACASGTASTGTTCSSNESNGVAFTIPVAGKYRACTSFSHEYSTNVTGSASSVFQIVETTNTSSAVVTSGTESITHGDGSNGIAHDSRAGMRVCSTFNAAAAGLKTLRLEYVQNTVATVISSVILADAGGGVGGGRNIHWEVYPITQNIPAPLLVGSVTSNSTGVERVERLTISPTCSGSPCTIASQSGSWVSSVTRSVTGQYAVNITSGIFSATPTCVVVPTSFICTAAKCATAVATPTSSTSVSIFAEYTDNSAFVDIPFQLMCMGQR